MAVIRLQLDIDSAVQPELHALLSAIAGTAAREERLRQLAASGLVWEQLRIDQQARRQHRPTAVAAQQPPLDAGAYESFLHELRSAVRELPVLTEVLDAGVADDGDPPPVSPPSPAVPATPARRNRLQRMKDKGLFRNE